MKFKTNTKKIQDSFYENIRYNPNTLGKHFMILNGKENNEKKECGMINILSLMTKIYSANGTNSKEKINMLINKSKEFIGDKNEL